MWQPFTIAERIMQETAESDLSTCLTPTEANPCSSVLKNGFVAERAVLPIGGLLEDDRSLVPSNCTVVCPPFLECVHAALLANRSQAAKRACLETRDGCTLHATRAPPIVALRLIERI